MKKIMKKRAGFTLVELLIVIIIIGILAGAMLLVAGSGTDKAEATKIVSDLRGLKAAALMFYADKPNDTPDIDALENYMDRKLAEESGDKVYEFKTSGDQWWVGRNTIKTGVKGKLADVAGDVGLHTAGYVAIENGGTVGDKVFIRAR